MKIYNASLLNCEGQFELMKVLVFYFYFLPKFVRVFPTPVRESIRSEKLTLWVGVGRVVGTGWFDSGTSFSIFRAASLEKKKNGRRLKMENGHFT